jgi:hypothetical protein
MLMIPTQGLGRRFPAGELLLHWLYHDPDTCRGPLLRVSHIYSKAEDQKNWTMLQCSKGD